MTAPTAPQSDDWLQQQFDYVLAKATGKTYPGQRQKRVDEAIAVIRSRISEAEAAAELRGRIDELNEARKWSTKANTADQVWQQLTDRIKQLQARQADKPTLADIASPNPSEAAQAAVQRAVDASIKRQADTSGREG